MIKKALALFEIALVSATVCTVGYFNKNDLAAYSSSNATITDVTSNMDRSVWNQYLSSIMNGDAITGIDNILTQECRVIVETNNESMYQKYEKANSELSFSDYMKLPSSLTQARNINKSIIDIQKRVANTVSVKAYNYTYNSIFTGFSMTVMYKDLATLETIDGVKNVIICENYDTPSTEDVAEVQSEIYNDSVDMVNGNSAKDDYGYTGQGMVIGILDTGIDLTHEAFSVNPVNPKIDIDGLAQIVDQTAASALYYSAQYAQTDDPSTIESLTADDLYYSPKIPFQFDYADVDTNAKPTEDAVLNYGNDHGTHVAGIAAGNNGKDFQGVASDAQLAIFKVFSDEASGASSDTVLYALSDALILGVDTINMSLGSPAGFSREIDSVYINQLYEEIRTAGINLYCSAGNSYSSTFQSTYGDNPLLNNPDFGIISSASSYEAAMSVASIESLNNTKQYYLKSNDLNIFFYNMNMLTADGETSTSQSFYDDLASTGVLALGKEADLEYIKIPNAGEESDYAGLNVRGKVVLVNRGTTTFTDKIKTAKKMGASAIILVDNKVEIYQSFTVDYAKNYLDEYIPAISISYAAGQSLPSEGVIHVGSNQVFSGYLMSDFSSWGPLPNLELKPEITAPGGNVYSSLPTYDTENGYNYGTMSGTSMASPNMAGVATIVKQYVEDVFYNITDTVQIENLVNQLLMSTAVVIDDPNGNPYSPRKQGAGLANIQNVLDTNAYIYVNGQNKTKIELGDDKNRTGVYTLNFRVKNFSTGDISYKINPIVMTEDVLSGFIAEASQVITDSDISYKVSNNAKLNGNILTVPANTDAQVSVTIKLSDTMKSYLDSTFENGIYIDGFCKLEGLDDSTVDLSVPYLAFYGDWSEAPILDSNAYDDEDAAVFDTFISGIMQFSYGSYEWQFGEYPWYLNEGDVAPEFTLDKIAIAPSAEEGMIAVYGIYMGLLRNARTVEFTAVDVSTGEVVFEYVSEFMRKSFYNSGSIYPSYDYYAAFPTYDLENNTTIKYTIRLTLDYDDPQNNKNNEFSFDIFIDYEAPRIINDCSEVYYENGKAYIDLDVYDNHYALDYSLWTYSGDMSYPLGTVISDNPTPIHNFNRGTNNTIKLDISSLINQTDANGNPILKEETIDGEKYYCFVVGLEDYALNASTYLVKIKSADVSSVDIENTISLDINEMYKITPNCTPNTAVNQFFTYTSSNENVAIVDQSGYVLAVGQGNATIHVKSNFKLTDGSYYEKDISVVVSSTVSAGTSCDSITLSDDAENGVLILFDSSKAGMEISLYDYIVGNPWYAVNYNVDFTITSNTAAYADEGDTLPVVLGENGILTINNYGFVTVMCEYGSSTLELNIYILKEFDIRENYELGFDFNNDGVVDSKDSATTLVYYNGVGGDVVIPEGVEVIYDFAFENSNVESVTFPSTLKRIGEQAFYYNFDLKEVDLSHLDEIQIGEGAFAWCLGLETVLLPDVVWSDESAFHTCESLSTVQMPSTWNEYIVYFEMDENGYTGEITESRTLNKLPQTTFSKCTSLTSIVLPDNLEIIGVQAFYECTIESGNINFPSTLTRIETQAFDFACFTTLDLSHTSLTTIDNEAFARNEQLTTVKLPSTVEEIGSSAFYYCHELSSFNFTDLVNLKKLHSRAFYHCSSLTDIDLSNSKVSIFEDEIFANSYDVETGKGITSVIFPSTLEYVGAGLFTNCENLTTVTFNGVQHIEGNSYIDGQTGEPVYVSPAIGDSAFRGCTKLTSINLPEGILYIGENAFTSSGIRTITIPESVTRIESYAFSSCTNLSSVVFAENANIESIGTYAFYGAFVSTGAEIKLPTAKDLVIDSYAFDKANITKMVVPTNVTSVGMYAFAETPLLTSCVFEGDIDTIPDFLFVNSAITDVTFNGKVNNIQSNAFRGTKISTLTLPNSDIDSFLTINGNFTFGSMPNLQTIVFQENTNIDESSLKTLAFAFFLSSKISKFIVNPNNSSVSTNDDGTILFTKDGTKIVMGAPTLGGDLVIPENVSEIYPYAFARNNNITSLDLANVEKIYTAAFLECSNMVAELDLSAITYLGNQAFSSCTNVTSVILPDNATYVGNSAFSLTGVTEVVIPGSISVVPSLFFAFCPNLTSVTIEEGVEKISNSAFAATNDTHIYTSNLSSLVLPDSLEEIHDYAFSGQSYLENLVVGSSLVYIGTGAFRDTGISGTLDLKNVLSIGESAFENCLFTNVKLSKQAMYVYESAFKNCDNLIEVTLPARIIYLGDEAFAGCDSLAEVNVPKGLAPILLVASTFEECNSLEAINVEEGNKYYKSVDGVLFTADMKELTIYPLNKVGDSYEIPEGVITIYAEAFKNNRNLKMVVFPESLQSIGDLAFYQNAQITMYEFRSKNAPILKFFNTNEEINGYNNFGAYLTDETSIGTYYDRNIAYVPENGVGYDEYPFANFFKTVYSDLPAVVGDDVESVNNMLESFTVTYSSKELADEIVAAYNALSDDDKKLVVGYNKIESFMQYASQYENLLSSITSVSFDFVSTPDTIANIESNITKSSLTTEDKASMNARYASMVEEYKEYFNSNILDYLESNTFTSSRLDELTELVNQYATSAKHAALTTIDALKEEVNPPVTTTTTTPTTTVTTTIAPTTSQPTTGTTASSSTATTTTPGGSSSNGWIAALCVVIVLVAAGGIGFGVMYYRSHRHNEQN